MKQMFWILLLTGIGMAATARAADVTGKWTGTMVLNTEKHEPACVHLKQAGQVITGTQGPSDDQQFPITSGRFDGEQVSIEAHPGSSVLRLTMKLNRDRMSGDVFEDDQKIGTVSLQKAAQ